MPSKRRNQNGVRDLLVPKGRSRPPVECFYDRHALEYDSWYEDRYSTMYDAVTWSYLDRCLGEYPPPASVLDVGGGTGYASLPLLKRGYTVVMVDVSLNMLKAAHTRIKQSGIRTRCSLLRADACQMDVFNTNTFDIVIAQGDTVSYASNPHAAIEECIRVLKPNGLLSISVANKWFHAFAQLADGGVRRCCKVLQTGMSCWFGKGKGSFPIRTFTIQELHDAITGLSCRVLFDLVKLPITREVIERASLSTEAEYRSFVELLKRLAVMQDLSAAAEHVEVIAVKPPVAVPGRPQAIETRGKLGLGTAIPPR